MAELADAPDLGSGGEIHAGSIPVTRIKFMRQNNFMPVSYRGHNRFRLMFSSNIKVFQIVTEKYTYKITVVPNGRCRDFM